MLAHAHFVNLPAIWPFYFVADAANFVIPTKLTLLGGTWAAPFAKHFPGILQEQGSYIGLPLLAIFIAYAIEPEAQKLTRFLLVLLGVFLVASLGPQLWAGGKFTGLPLPWAAFLHLPFISSALPVRFALFVSLVSSIILAYWAGGSRFRLGLGFIACVALLPAPHLWTRLPVSTFFAPGVVQAALGSHSRLLVLPFGPNGASTYWQVQNDFDYDQIGGYLGFPPQAMQHFSAVGDLFAPYQSANLPAELETFVQANGAQYVVAGPGTSAALQRLLAQLHWASRQVDDVTIYTVPDTAHD
jgi:hypothetical protein